MKSFRPLASHNAKKRKSLRSQWPWFVLFFLLVGGAGAWYFLWGPGKNQAGSPTGPQTYTTVARRGDLSISASGSGKLVAYRSVDLSFSTSGSIAEVNVAPGDVVTAGQVLARLSDSATLEANLAAAKLQVLTAQQKLTVLQQSADLNLAQAYSDMVSTQQAYNSALETSQKTTTARCSKETNARLLATLERATTQLENIHAETSGSEVYISAKQAYDTALANYQFCAGYSSDEKDSAQSALEVARTKVAQAQDKYETLKAASGIDPNELALDEANLKQAQAQLANAEEQLAGVILIAPFDGKVTYLADTEGALVDTSKFITVVDISQALLDVSVDESDLNQLVVDVPVTVTFDALPDVTFQGKLVQVNPTITTSGQYRIAKAQAALDEAATKTVAALPLGLNATVVIVTQEAKNALLVPAISLKDLGDNTYGVMVKDSDGQFRLQTVTVGIKDKDYAIITSGLEEGDLVSTGTVNFIAAGSDSNSSSLKNAQDSGGFPGMPPAP